MKAGYVALIDVSASMSEGFSPRELETGDVERPSKFECAKEHIYIVLKRLQPPLKLMLIAFGEAAEVVYVGDVEDQQSIAKAMARLKPDGRRTNLSAALHKALLEVSSDPTAIHHVDVFTDGLSNTGDPVAPACELKNRGVEIEVYLLDSTEQGLDVARSVAGHEDRVHLIGDNVALRQKANASAEKLIDRLESLDIIWASRVENYERFGARTGDRPAVSVKFPDELTSEEWEDLNWELSERTFDWFYDKQRERLDLPIRIDRRQRQAVLEKSIVKNAIVTLRVRSDSLRANPNVVEFHWYEPLFRQIMRVTTNTLKTTLSTVSVQLELCVDSLPAGSVEVEFKVADGRVLCVPPVAEIEWFGKVFICYSPDDQQMAEAVADRYKGIGIWPEDEQLLRRQHQASFHPLVVRALKEADVFLLFLPANREQFADLARIWKLAVAVAQEKNSAYFLRTVTFEPYDYQLPDELASLIRHDFAKARLFGIKGDSPISADRDAN